MCVVSDLILEKKIKVTFSFYVHSSRRKSLGLFCDGVTCSLFMYLFIYLLFICLFVYLISFFEGWGNVVDGVISFVTVRMFALFCWLVDFSLTIILFGWLVGCSLTIILFGWLGDCSLFFYYLFVYLFIYFWGVGVVGKCCGSYHFICHSVCNFVCLFYVVG